MSAYALPLDPTSDRGTRWMQVLGRLKPDVTLPQAQVGLQPWFKALLEEDTRRAGFPKITAQRRQRFLASTLELTPAPQGHSALRRTLSQPLWVLFTATGVLLALACLNVAGLFLARGSARDREISTRFALGASRGRIAYGPKTRLLPSAAHFRGGAETAEPANTSLVYLGQASESTIGPFISDCPGGSGVPDACARVFISRHWLTNSYRSHNRRGPRT